MGGDLAVVIAKLAIVGLFETFPDVADPVCDLEIRETNLEIFPMVNGSNFGAAKPALTIFAAARAVA